MADRKYELLANMTNGDTDLVIGEITVYDGEDGFAPIVSLSKTDNITTLEITDKNGLQKVEILDGTMEDIDLTEYAKKNEVPTKTSQLTNDSGYLTSAPVISVNSKTGAVTLSASDVGADPTGTAGSAIDTHNTNAVAHNDIRVLIENLTTRFNTLANSDDTTLDQLSEIVAYIKNNKTLIEQVTTNKVNVTDIINNLTTNVGNKPLSAAQGVALKSLIDAIKVPTKVSELTNDAGYLTEHQSLAEYAKTADLGKLASKDAVEKTDLSTAVQTSLGKADSALQSYTETDPTVPSWAKTSTKPTYTASEVGAVPTTRTVNGKALSSNITLGASDVGALPATTSIPSKLSDLTADSTHRLVTDTEKSTWNAKANTSDIPTKVSQLTNDKNYLTSYTETDPTVPSWAKASTKPSYTKSEVGLGNVDNVKQYSASNPPPYPVTSVNGETGAVTLKIPDEIYVGNGDMPETATIQILLDGSDAEEALKDELKDYIDDELQTVASAAISMHNASTSAHADIREQINQLSSEKVNESQLNLAVNNALAEQKDEFVSAVITQVPLVKAPSDPIFVDSRDKMTDTSKVYAFDGKLYKYMTSGNSGLVADFTNRADPTPATDTALTPTSAGWMKNVRINSSAAITKAEPWEISNLVSCTKTDVIRVQGMDIYSSNVPSGASAGVGAYARIYCYNNGAYVGHVQPNQCMSAFQTLEVGNVAFTLAELLTASGLIIPSINAIRIGGVCNTTSSDVIITVNEEIKYKEASVLDWTVVGTYAANICTDLVGVVGENNVIYLSANNLPSGTYTLKWSEGNYETIGTITI